MKRTVSFLTNLMKSRINWSLLSGWFFIYWKTNTLIIIYFEQLSIHWIGWLSNSLGVGDSIKFVTFAIDFVIVFLQFQSHRDNTENTSLIMNKANHRIHCVQFQIYFRVFPLGIGYLVSIIKKKVSTWDRTLLMVEEVA